MLRQQRKAKGLPKHVHYNEVCYIEVLRYIFYYYWGKKISFVVPRTSLQRVSQHRGSTISTLTNCSLLSKTSELAVLENLEEAWIRIPCKRAAVSKLSARFLAYSSSDVAMTLTWNNGWRRGEGKLENVCKHTQTRIFAEQVELSWVQKPLSLQLKPVKNLSLFNRCF